MRIVEQLELSEKSRKFIDNLRLYLFSSGKNDQEIKEIAEELEIHLHEAELKNKSIDQIVGGSPKEYMESISSEMKTDYKAWSKYIVLIIIGSMSFSIFGDLLQGTLSYSILKITGMLIHSILFLTGVFMVFRIIAKNQFSKMKEIIMITLPIFISTIFFVGVLVADSFYHTPVIDFGIFGSTLIGLLFLGLVIFFSIWAKTAVMLVILIALHLPEELLAFTTFSEITQLIVGLVITYLLIGVYFVYILKKEKKNAG